MVRSLRVALPLNLLSFLALWVALAMAPEPATAFSANYRQALSYSLHFYNAQRSGAAPEGILWRGDANVDDAVPGGWHDAGDGVKFNLPMANAAAVLAWGALEFPDGYKQAGQMNALIEVLTFVADYFVRCWDSKEKTVVVGIGDPHVDHSAWISPEMIQYAIPDSRKVYRVSAESPGSDAVAEMAAALAAVGLLRKENGMGDNGFFEVADDLLKFASDHLGKYSDAHPIVQPFYNSWSGFWDELAWAEIWLYKVDADKDRLSRALDYYEKYGKANPTFDDIQTLSWDDKALPVALLLDQIHPPAKEIVQPRIDANRKHWLSTLEGDVKFTIMWGSLRYNANQAFMAEIASKLAGGDKEWEAFSEQQINYILGNNPDDFSYVIGYGKNYPQHPHHRGAHGPFNNDTDCCPDETRHTLYGALVGGPTKPGGQGYQDVRGDYVSNEVACDYNAGYSSALAALIARKASSDDDSSFPGVESERGTEFALDSFDLGSSSSLMEVEIVIRQMTSWPARRSAIGFRYFFDLSDDDGPDNLLVELASVGGATQRPSVSALKVWPEGDNLYYVDVAWPKDRAPYPVGANHIARIELRFSAKDDSLSFDRSRDWSHPSRQLARIPLYESMSKVAGEEPDGSRQDAVKGGSKPRPTDPPAPEQPGDVDGPDGEQPGDVSESEPEPPKDESSCDGLVWTVDQSWPGGFMVDVKVPGAVSGTTVGWEWAKSGVNIESSWNVEIDEDTGSMVSLTLMAETFGFVTTTSDQSSAKAIGAKNFKLNGQLCSGGGGGDVEKSDSGGNAGSDDEGTTGGEDDENPGNVDTQTPVPMASPSVESPNESSPPVVFTPDPAMPSTPGTPNEEVEGVFPDAGDTQESSSATPEATDQDDGDNDSNAACFPAGSVVEVEGKGLIPIEDLKIGERVRTGPGDDPFSRVFFFSHREGEVSSPFLTIYFSHSDVMPIRVSPGHYLIDGTTLNLRAASSIEVGDTLVCGLTGQQMHVSGVRRDLLNGLYNPHTENGRIVVDGIQASVYTTAVDPRIAELLLGPLRYLTYFTHLPSKWTGLARLLPSGSSVCSRSEHR